jgi:hypothetical protein
LNPSESVLLIEVGERHCCFGIIDHLNRTLHQLRYFTFEENDHDGIIQNTFEKHEELQRSFYQAIVSYYMPGNMLIPSRFYNYENTFEQLQTMYDKTGNVMVAESVPQWQLYNAYYVPSGLHSFISKRFTTGSSWHVYSTLLQNKIEQDDNGSLLVDFKTDSFSVVVTKANELLLAQIFSYSRGEDVLYQLLKICKLLSLSQTDVKLLLSGLIERRSAVFEELYMYFIHIEFASPANDIRLSEAFAEYPVHFFSSLYKLAACVS